MWRKIRTGFLLYVLIMVGVGSWLTRARTTDWDETLWVNVFPINADGSATSAAYMRSLSRADVAPIAEFFAAQARRYNLALARPIRVELGPVISDPPPDPPRTRNALSVALWSLRLRYWAATLDKGGTPPGHIEIFVKYFDPQTHERLAHSFGLQKGLLGIANVFADSRYRGSNRIVIAHELLHTLGASDKYDPRTNQPLYPQGIADPALDPLYPQKMAEIMAGRIARSATDSVTPQRLSQALVGPATAREINWVR